MSWDLGQDVPDLENFMQLWANFLLPIFAPSAEINIRKSENQKMETQNDYRAGTSPAQIPEMESVKNSFLKDMSHEVI